jgi:hypothetical protein
MTPPRAMGPLGGKSQVDATKYFNLVLAIVLEVLEVWGFITGVCWVDMLPDVVVAMPGRSACSRRIAANHQQERIIRIHESKSSSFSASPTEIVATESAIHRCPSHSTALSCPHPTQCYRLGFLTSTVRNDPHVSYAPTHITYLSLVHV